MTDYNFSGNKCRTAYNREGEKYVRSTPATLDESGESLLTSTKSLIQALDPDGTAMIFAFITDLHRSEDGIYTTNTIDDRYSLRLLSRLCDEVDFDAVFCGGDITNARDENAEYFRENMGDVVDDFDDLMPYTSIYSNVGNHDKRYSTSRPLNTNEWIGELWSQVQCDGNAVELHYIDDTNFYVDFLKHKVRIIFINQYDDVDSNSSWYANENISSSTGIHTRGTTAWKAAIPSTDKAEWIIGAVIHGADNSSPSNPTVRSWTFTDLSDTLKTYVDGGGKGVLGIFAGHYHISQDCTLSAFNASNPAIPICHINRAYATESEIGTTSAYCFSVFLVNPKTGIFHEIRVGKNAIVIPFHVYDQTQNGLLQNGTVSPNTSWNKFYCVFDGNHVRFDRRWNAFCYGINFTNLPYMWGYYANDMVTGDTANVLFSASAGDVIKTEIIFSDDTDAESPAREFTIFSPQIPGMVTGTVVAGAKYTNEITLAEAVNVTAIGMNYRGNTQASAGSFEFELNVYKNGVKLVRSS